MIKFYSFTILFFLCTFFNVQADDLTTAKELFNMADYDAALPIFQQEIERNPRSKQIGQIYQWAGECAFNIGDGDLANEYFLKAKAKNITDANRYLGLLAYQNYDFEAADEFYAKYEQLRKKAKKEIPSDVADEMSKLALAQSLLDRVEKITIIDSIAVPRKEFFKHYRISPDCGSLNPISDLPFDIEDDEDQPGVAFSNENKDFFIWADTDTLGFYRINESIRLIDKSWHSPIVDDETLNDGGDARYPFMMPDGVTLYFANNGENSIGGYDIFISNKDADTGEYMTPSNIGMPYNSPFDDYMFAIDENLGVGWWATDRNRLPDDMITIYVFITNEIRICYNTDEVEVTDFARISDYKTTWQPDTDYSEILSAIAKIDPNAKPKQIDFYFPIGNGIVYHNLNDFKTAEGRNLMSRYLEAEKSFIEFSNQLSSLRLKYHQSPTDALATQIKEMESVLESKRSDLFTLKNEIYKIERK